MFSKSVDIAWLATLRILYGVSMGISLLRLIHYGWLEELFIRPRFHFKYWGFAWVAAPSESTLLVLAWVLVALAALVTLGCGFRIAAPCFVAGFTYLQLIDVTTYLNHYYLASLLGLLLTASPAHRAWSIDAWLRPTLRRTSVLASWHWLFRFQVGVVYTFAGVAKAHGDWLMQAQPLSLWLASRTDLPWLGDWFRLPHVPLIMSWAGFLFDATIVWWLLWQRTRLFAFSAVLLFHALTRALFPIGMFPFIMVGSALVFFPPDWPRKTLGIFIHLVRAREYGTAPKETQPTELVSSESSRERRAWKPLLLALAGGYCLIQLLVPLRFLVYGGNVRWHEQGMRFSWRVMVREKNGSITYVVRNPRTQRTWQVPPHRYLTPLQEREISGQPDLILQLAHHIQRDFEQRHLGSVEVRVNALVSLNGRRARPLIDPTVDLTRIRDGLNKQSWILPAPSEAAPKIRPI